MKADNLKNDFSEFSVGNEILGRVTGGIYVSKTGASTFYQSPPLPGQSESDFMDDFVPDANEPCSVGSPTTNVHTEGSTDLLQLEMCVVDSEFIISG